MIFSVVTDWRNALRGRKLVMWGLLLSVGTLVTMGMGCKEKKTGRSSQRDAVKKRQGKKSKGLAEKIRELDHGALPYIRKLDAKGLLGYRRRTGATICGIGAIALLLETLKQSGVEVGVSVLDYYTSGEVTGDWTNTVSYLTLAFYAKGPLSGGASPSKGGAEKGLKEGKKGTQEEKGEGGDKEVRAMATGPGWYPKTSAALARKLSSLMKKAKKAELPGRLLALVAPHAGFRYSGRAAAAGYRLLPKDTERVVVMGVSHRVRLRGISIAPYTHYRTPFGDLPVDTEEARRLRAYDIFQSLEPAHRREHSIEVQLPFIYKRAPETKIVPLLVGALSEKDYSSAALQLKELVKSGTVFVASSDFTHRGPQFGYEPFNPKR